ncbi:MAG: magnesium-translocating P-type ATPase [Deltaproteobacteria bacterium]|nr:magnesium-translocating P-type ATPase [Deltaproteobacteria bacterium]
MPPRRRRKSCTAWVWNRGVGPTTHAWPRARIGVPRGAHVPSEIATWLLPPSRLLPQLGAREGGLSSPEARLRLEQHGPNEPVPHVHKGPAVAVRSFLANPLMVILLAASVVSALLGEPVDALIIFAMIALGLALNVLQTYRSQRTIERLRAGLAPTATVLRDGNWCELPRREVVPGDVFRLSAGDLVPADARLLESRDLHINQAALTGESLPVEKDVLDATSTELLSNHSVVLFGTSVVGGTATAVAFATGKDTAFGDIASVIAARPPETEFERGASRFGLLIMRTVFVLVIAVELAALAAGRPAFESLLFAVALAVGLTPEFLPMISTVTLSRGAQHMASKQVLVKNLAAIQNFGSIDILCCDKTGTLTSGEMRLEQHLDPFGAPSERVFLLGYLNCLHQTGVQNGLNEAVLAQATSRNPLDAAVLGHGQPDVHSYRKLDEIPFDFERRRQSVVVEWGQQERLLITKGAPEAVLELCTSIELEGKCEPLTDASRARTRATFDGLSREGFRILAIATRTVPVQAAYDKREEHDFVLNGYLAFIDPPLERTAVALQALHRDGVEVKILTGDNELVAQHVCKQVGLHVRRAVLGDELSRTTDAALAKVAEDATVFARVSPAQKNRILQALKSHGHVVGFLGDGINDAPSLHAADVGISVASGVDVAKDAAEIILLERDLAVLHAGIIEGRKAFGNIVKYLLMETSSNFGNMFSMAAAFLFLPFLPMLPTQIILNNFLYDLAQVTIPTDWVDPTFIRKPRRWDIATIRNFMLAVGPISSLYDFLTFAALLRVFHAPEQLFQTGWFVESLATQTLVIFVIRTSGNPFRSRPSLPLTITTLSVVAVGLVLPVSPLAKLFGFTPLPGSFYGFLVVATLTYVMLVAVIRGWMVRREAGRPTPQPPRPELAPPSDAVAHA